MELGKRLNLRIGGMFASQLLAAGLGFALVILLARLLGVEGYGIYAFAMAIVTVLTIIASLGLPGFLTREVARRCVSGEKDIIKGMCVWSFVTVIAVCLVLGVITLLVLLYRGEWDVTAITIICALAVLVINAVTVIVQSILNGFQHVVVGQTLIRVLRPLLFIVLILIIYYSGFLNVTPVLSVGLNAVASLIVLLLIIVFLFRSDFRTAKTEKPAFLVGDWMRGAIPFFLIAGVNIINDRADIIMLGLLKDTASSGIYSVAVVGSELISYILVAVNMVVAPIIATLYKRGKLSELQVLITRSARLVLLVSLPVVGLLFMFSGNYLSLFGADFRGGTFALQVLCAAQLINALTGSVGVVLNMTGNEKISAIGIGVAAVINITLNLFLIPLWGMAGAAIATLASMVVWNLSLYYWVVRRIGLDTTSLGMLVRYKV